MGQLFYSRKRLQLEAARIVTGTTRSVSLRNLYQEIGWLTLEDRRAYQKLILTFKIYNNMVPDYLSALFPRNENPVYNLRHHNDFLTLPRRTVLFERSCVLSCINLWNSLPENLRNIPTLGLFKTELKRTLFPTIIVPAHFLHGNRQMSIIHTRLRNKCSNLNYDLFTNHVSDSNLCLHCSVPETVDHFFFHCERFNTERIYLFRETHDFHPISSNTLLFGKSNLNYEQNITIVNAVHKFIKNTKRFSNT